MGEEHGAGDSYRNSPGSTGQSQSHEGLVRKGREPRVSGRPSRVQKRENDIQTRIRVVYGSGSTLLTNVPLSSRELYRLKMHLSYHTHNKTNK